ncbi:MAG: hypothetical protein JXA67_00360 [Micromonosporaceae bacterium]|nr:hypothetical protein [Micromonosporaceae bacterium]
MTIGSESFSNGSSKSEERFPSQLGQYRPGGRREAGRVASNEASADLSPRNGTGMLDPRNAVLESRKASHDARGTALDSTAPIASSIMASKLGEPVMRDLNDLTQPVAAAHCESWDGHAAGSLVDHPLLRGLLLELPPKGALPPPEYLDRWFEAARSILDLLYTMNARS